MEQLGQSLDAPINLEIQKLLQEKKEFLWEEIKEKTKKQHPQFFDISSLADGEILIEKYFCSLLSVFEPFFDPLFFQTISSFKELQKLFQKAILLSPRKNISDKKKLFSFFKNIPDSDIENLGKWLQEIQKQYSFSFSDSDVFQNTWAYPHTKNLMALPLQRQINEKIIKTL